MTNEKLDELEKLLKAADGRTIEPKPYAADDGYGPSDVWLMAFHPLKGAYNMADGVSKEDAALIVAAINALPELVASARRVAELEHAIHDVLASLENDQTFYDRNGPAFTSPAGYQYENTADVLACSAERAGILRAALQAKGAPT